MPAGKTSIGVQHAKPRAHSLRLRACLASGKRYAESCDREGDRQRREQPHRKSKEAEAPPCRGLGDRHMVEQLPSRMLTIRSSALRRSRAEEDLPSGMTPAPA